MVAQANVNYLLQHKEEVILFLKENSIVILCISLSHFNAEIYSTISNYNMYNTNHTDGTANGDTAILIKQSIKHYQLKKF